jgi:hypothetical protein
MARMICRLKGGVASPSTLLTDPREEDFSQAYLIALSGETFSANTLTQTVGYHLQDPHNTFWALRAAQGLLEAGQLGDADLTQGNAATQIYTLASVLDERADITSLRALKDMIADTTEGRPSMTDANILETISSHFEILQDIDNVIGEAFCLSNQGRDVDGPTGL